MSWVKVDDHLPHHPKIMDVPIPARWAYIEGLCYVAQYLTDGYIPEAQVKLIAPGSIRSELCAVGLWHEVIKGGIQVHDYLDYNPTKAKVLEERERGRRRKSEWNTGGNPEESGRNLREVRAKYG